MIKKATWISTRLNTNGFWYYTTPEPAIVELIEKIDILLETHGISKTNTESEDGLTFNSTLEFENDDHFLIFIETLRETIPDHMVLRHIFYTENNHQMLVKFFDEEDNVIEETVIYV